MHNAQSTFDNTKFKIQNSKLILRALEPEDADFMYEVEQDPAAWEYSDYVAPLSREMLRHYALTYDADPFRSGQLRLIVEYQGKPIGIADLFDISAKHLRGDTGIYILPENRGKELGVETLLALKDYCRNRLGLHQIVANISKLNASALRCFDKAGFRETGIRPDWWRTPDGYEDVAMLTLKL